MTERRRSPHDDEPPATPSSNPNVFADDFAVNSPAASEYEFDISDGFRPEVGSEGPSHQESSSSGISRTRATEVALAENKRSRLSLLRGRNSIAKNPAVRHSFTLANDGSRAPLPQRIVASTGAGSHSNTRPVSQVSNFAPHDESPVSPIDRSHGISNGLQVGPPIGRTISRTHSTARPAHPYAMYQQNTEPAAEHEPGSSTIQAQVGFPGRSVDYRRQIGPDGEDQFIVGPDGHTEQLPPYTEHPDANEKAYAARSAVPRASLARSHASLETLVANAQAPAIRTPARMSSDQTLTVSAGAGVGSSMEKSMAGKAWKEKTWREKRKTRVCFGLLPLWMLLVAAGCLLFVTVVLAATIGGLLSKKSHASPAESTVTVLGTPSMLGVIPIPTPQGLAPLPTGAYFLKMAQAEETLPQCVVSRDQSSAWSCNVQTSPLTIEMSQPPNGWYIAKIFPDRLRDDAPASESFTYGSQPPMILPPQQLDFVQDQLEPQRGPALHFQRMYNKVVVLPGNAFQDGKAKEKRQVLPDVFGPPAAAVASAVADAHGPRRDFQPYPPPFPPPPPFRGPPPPNQDQQQNNAASQPLSAPFWHRKNQVRPGDEPWFCYWNATFIEGFIYVKQPVQNTSTAFTTPSPSMTASSTVTGMLGSANAATTPVASLPGATDPTPTNPTPLNRRYAYPSPSAAPEPIPQRHNKEMAAPTSDFPYVVKIVERRRTNGPSSPPECHKKAIAEDGSISAVLDDDGRPVIVKILERDPSDAEFRSAAAAAAAIATMNSRVKRNAVSESTIEKRGGNPGNSCACRWIIS